MQTAEGRQWWMLTFGSSEIQSHAARLTSKHAIHLAMLAGLLLVKVSFYHKLKTGSWLQSCKIAGHEEACFIYIILGLDCLTSVI